MSKKAFFLSILTALAISACGGEKSGQPEQNAAASEAEDAAQSASDYAAYSSASDTPPPDVLPDDAAASGAAKSGNGGQEKYEAAYQANGQTVKVTYETINGQPSARISINNAAPVIFKQTDSWGTGGAYSNGKATWIDNGDSADLEQDGKTVTYQQTTPVAAP